MIEVQNIAGRLYISRTAIAEFERRVEKGEFSKRHRTPTRTKEPPAEMSADRLSTSKGVTR
jgi:hypothetical protein